MRSISLLVVILLSVAANEVLGAKKVVRFNYYSEPISLEYDSGMEVLLSNDVSEEGFQRFYYDLENTNYHATLGEFHKYRKKLKLNDWLYYVLVRQATEKIFQHKNENYKTLFCWFMLHKSGYKVQLNYLHKQVMLSVFSKDKVYDMPVRKHQDGWFVDLTTYHKREVKRQLTTYGSKFKLNNSGNAFSFKLTELPKLSRPEIISKKLAFVHDDKLHTIKVDLNKNIIHIMYRYPELSVTEHAKVPLSIRAYATLMTSLGKLIKGKSDYEAARLLLSFTRQARDYKTDKDAYKLRNVTFAPEETLFYKYSDCEDRSVLFSYLVKELLGLDVILLDYPEHATTAVLFDKSYGVKPIVYKGRKYTLCDPTGPGNYLRPGQYPEDLLTQHYTILD